MHFVGRLRFDDILAVPFFRRFPNNGAILFLNSIKYVRHAGVPSAVGENCVSKGEFGESDFTAAQERGGKRTESGSDSSLVAKLNDGINPNGHSDSNCG